MEDILFYLERTLLPLRLTLQLDFVFLIRLYALHKILQLTSYFLFFLTLVKTSARHASFECTLFLYKIML